MYRFLVTASIVVLLGLFYLGKRLIPTIWPAPVRIVLWLVLVIMIANLLWLPFKRWRLSAKSRAKLLNSLVTRVLENCAYNVMGLLSLLLAFTALSELIRFLFTSLPQTWQGDLLEQIPAGQNFESILAVTIFSTAGLFFMYGRFITARGPQSHQVHISIPLTGRAKRRPRFKRRANTKPMLRLLQISDLHIGRAIKRQYVEKVVARINSERPDIVCFTGDIGDGIASTLTTDAAPLSSIIAPHGIYYVPGNHEYYWGLRSWLDLFKDLGFIQLLNRGKAIETSVGKIFIAGVVDPTAARFGEDLPKIPPREASDIAILLAHHPNFARSADAKHYDLMLAGHTHGGQYIPWTWIARIIFRFAHGLYRYGNLLVYVNAGTGYWGAPLRIGTKPEMTIFDIHYEPRLVSNDR